MAVAAQARAVAMAAEIGGHVLWQKARRPRPTTADEVPVRVEWLTREWLQAVLCADTPGAHVTGFSFGEWSIGTTTRRPMTVSYDAAGQAAGLPEALFVKTCAPMVSRLLVGVIGAHINEARFYETLRPLADVEAPVGYYLGLGGRAQHATFLLEDVARTRGATFLHADAYVDRAMAEDQVKVMAAYHSAFWADPRLASTWTWLRDPLAFQGELNDLTNFHKRTGIGFRNAVDVVPPKLYARREEVFPAAMRSLVLASAAPQTLCHHDTHVGNWYRTGEGRMGLYDWQGTVRGLGIGDVAYGLACGLTVEDRRAWERELVELWVGSLTVPAASRPTVDEAWLAYRQQQFHGLIFWLWVAGQGRFQPETHPERLWRIVVERLTTAVDDLNALGALDERPEVSTAAARA